MENYVAIDNVCAWPNIKKMSSGEIIAIIFNQPCHLDWEGTIDCWINREGDGWFWEFCSNPVINKPTTNRGNVAVGINKTDEIIVLCSGWDNVFPKPEKIVQGAINDETLAGSFKKRLPLWPVCCVSKDKGKSWHTQDIKIENVESNTLWIPYGDIITLENGNLGCSMYFSKKCKVDGYAGSYFFESSDNGITWKCASCIYENGNETALVKLPNGKILAAARTIDTPHIDLIESRDSGKSWNYVNFLTGKKEYPAAFTILKEGFLLLTHGIRRRGQLGIGAQLMNLNTEKWQSRPIILSDLGTAPDGGYPSSIQLAEGKIVTAYYAKGSPYHSRYHMGIKIWTLEELPD